MEDAFNYTFITGRTFAIDFTKAEKLSQAE